MFGLLFALQATAGGMYVDPPPPTPDMPRWTSTEIPHDLPLNANRTWFQDDDYPALSRKFGEEGAVRVGMSIDTGGRITECWIMESSGYPRLDAKTCELVLRRSRWNIKKIDGRAVPYRYSIKTNWILDADRKRPAPPANGPVPSKPRE